MTTSTKTMIRKGHNAKPSIQCSQDTVADMHETEASVDLTRDIAFCGNLAMSRKPSNMRVAGHNA